MERVLNPEKINLYIKEHMGNKSDMLASELPLKTTDDFVHIIYVRLYGQRKNMAYTVEQREEIEVNGYRFRNYAIRKKES